MKAPGTIVTLAVLTAGFAAAAVLGLSRLDAGTDLVRAQVPVLVALDMDPYRAPANGCPGNGATDCSLGSIETSVSTCPGGAFDFDVILDDLPPHVVQEGLGAVDFQLRWGGAVVPAEADVIDITAHAPINPQIQLLAQAAGSSAILDDPQALPVVTPPYEGSSYDLGTDESNPPFTHGTVGRYTATVSAAAPVGVYKLEFVPAWVAVDNVIPYDECVDGPGCTIQNGSFVLADSCAAGGIAELPDVAGDTGSSTGTYAALAGAAAAVALSAGAWYAKRRWAR
jgi:hypothetical protein